jgi:uncharacterized phage protein (TIGR01671 family)
MRPLKFRLWNGTIMYHFALGDDVMITDKPVMQFTGLTDRHGKEIYEGDIVKGDVPYLMVVVSIYGGLSIHPIRNLGQKHNELIAMPTNDAQTASWLMETEIIGNIYENPELIGK